MIHWQIRSELDNIKEVADSKNSEVNERLEANQAQLTELEKAIHTRDKEVEKLAIRVWKLE